MKKEVKYILIMLLIACVFFSSMYLYITNKWENHFSKLREEYPTIELNTSLSGKVQMIYKNTEPTVRTSKTYIGFQLEKQKYFAHTKHDKKQIKEVVALGDSIYKQEGDSFIYVYKRDTFYKFRLTDEQGYPLTNLKK